MQHGVTDHGLGLALDWKLLEVAKPALRTTQRPVKAEFEILNINRSVGAILSNEISKIYGGKGLPKGTIDIKFRGSAGQSFGAFGASGIRFELEGEANDYFGKGLSGAELIIISQTEYHTLNQKKTSSLVMSRFMELPQVRHISGVRQENVFVSVIQVRRRLLKAWETMDVST